MSSLSSPSWLSRIDLTPFTMGFAAEQIEAAGILQNFQDLAEEMCIGLEPVSVSSNAAIFTNERGFPSVKPFTVINPSACSIEKLTAWSNVFENFQGRNFLNPTHDNFAAGGLSSLAGTLKKDASLFQAGAVYFISAAWHMMYAQDLSSVEASYACLNQCMRTWRRGLAGRSQDAMEEFGLKLPENFSGIKALQNRILSFLYFFAGADRAETLVLGSPKPPITIPKNITARRFEGTILNKLMGIEIPTDYLILVRYGRQLAYALKFCDEVRARLLSTDGKDVEFWESNAERLSSRLREVNTLIKNNGEERLSARLKQANIMNCALPLDFYTNVILRWTRLPNTRDGLVSLGEKVKLALEKCELEENKDSLGQKNGGRTWNDNERDLRRILLDIDRQIAMVAKRDRG